MHSIGIHPPPALCPSRLKIKCRTERKFYEIPYQITALTQIKGARWISPLSRTLTGAHMDNAQTEARKTRARGWFEQLRDDICAAFERLENEFPADAPPGVDAP